MFNYERYMKYSIVGVIGVLILLFCIFFFVEVTTVKGNEIGVKETWNGGVIQEPLPPRTYFIFRFNEIFKYDLAPRVFVMNDKTTAEEPAEGRLMDSYLVQSSDQQDMFISSNLRWRIDPAKIIDYHKRVRSEPEEKLIRPEMLRIIKNHATNMTAIEAYSGVGLVELQNQIFEDLRMSLGDYILVDNYAVEHIRLDKEYVGQIVARQIATQAKLAADEQTKAATAKAELAKAEAMADLHRQVVAAERDKQIGVLAAEREARVRVLDAEAKREQVVLAAKGEKESGELRASAIIAIGRAEAESTKMKLSAYAVPGADAFVKIEVAKSVAEGFKNVTGYLPSDMQINLLSGSFLDSVNKLMSK